jgi:hypothetical protein
MMYVCHHIFFIQLSGNDILISCHVLTIGNSTTYMSECRHLFNILISFSLYIHPVVVSVDIHVKFLVLPKKEFWGRSIRNF